MDVLRSPMYNTVDLGCSENVYIGLGYVEEVFVGVGCSKKAYVDLEHLETHVGQNVLSRPTLALNVLSRTM
jgi:hypothetical protein